jgi:uncharacterized membrane protein YphA (DoxX/SURF4 family)
MTLTPDEVSRVRSLHVQLDMAEVEEIYLPLMSRLLSLYVAATQRLFGAQQDFLCTQDVEMPYIIGVAGSVAVGKSTMARLLRELLVRWPNVPKVDRVTTDGFLYPNSVLERQGLMERKGFPESYDLPALLHFLSDIKAGRRPVRAPVYSHLLYDVLPDQWVEIDRPDIHALRSAFGMFQSTGAVSHNLKEFADELDHDGYHPGKFWAPAIVLTQLVAGPMLALGLFTRLVACPIVIFLIVTNYERWRVGGFFLNKMGLEFTLLWTVAAFYFLVHGGGAISVDHILIRREF